ncbi:hypothetical protein SDC9_211957 [bioreactor metagenome]|uniref:Uncharacterized protein n=1 Tax=bioreactor metagenome TaxID=1076179 RepID=A0A645JLA6_9ZZZZ
MEFLLHQRHHRRRGAGDNCDVTDSDFYLPERDLRVRAADDEHRVIGKAQQSAVFWQNWASRRTCRTEFGKNLHVEAVAFAYLFRPLPFANVIELRLTGLRRLNHGAARKN